MRYPLLLLLALLLAFGPAQAQMHRKKGKRVPKSRISSAITAPVTENTISGHSPALDGNYPTADNAEDKRIVKPEKYKKSMRRALRKERRLARREERARRRRDRRAAKTQLANQRNPTTRTRQRRSR